MQIVTQKELGNNTYFAGKGLGNKPDFFKPGLKNWNFEEGEIVGREGRKNGFLSLIASDF